MGQGRLAAAEDRLHQTDVHSPGVRQVLWVDVERLIDHLIVDLEETVDQKLEQTRAHRGECECRCGSSTRNEDEGQEQQAFQVHLEAPGRLTHDKKL